MVSQIQASRLSKASLATGYLALLVGTVVAFRSPTTGYELSIYAATPAACWAGVAVALPVSLAVATAERTRSPLRDGALLLGATTVVSLVGLPLVRGYRHFGSGDALTHLGWTRDVLAGRLEPVEMLYPGIHTATIFVSKVLGVSASDAQLVVTLAFLVVYVAFVALCVGLLADGRWAVPVGVVAGLLVLPNNNVSVHLMAHPVTQSLLLLPLVVYLVLKYVVRTDQTADRLPVGTPVGALLGVVALALVLIHPQGALNVVGILASIAVVQFAFRRFGRHDAISGHRPVYVPTLVATLAFALWAPRHERVRSTTRTVVDGLLSGTVAGDEIAQRSASLTDLGASLSGLFVKLFLVPALFCLLAALLATLWYTGRLRIGHRQRNALFTYPIAALVPLTAAFLVFFASSMTTQHFRYVGFVMVPVTLLGAVAIANGASGLSRRVSPRAVGAGLVVFLLAVSALPLATMHASPFIYQPNGQVTTQHLEGFEATFERRDPTVAFAGVRSGPDRLLDATFGTEGARSVDVRGDGDAGAIPGPVWGHNLTSYYPDRRYLPVSTADYRREVELYDGFRYSERGFRRLDTSPRIDRVYSNGEYRLYLVGDGTD